MFNSIAVEGPDLTSDTQNRRPSRLFEVVKWCNDRPDEDQYPDTIYLVRALTHTRAAELVESWHRETHRIKVELYFDAVYEAGICYPPLLSPGDEFHWGAWDDQILRGPYYEDAICRGAQASWHFVEEAGLWIYDGVCPECGFAGYDTPDAPKCAQCGWDRTDPAWSVTGLPDHQ